MLIVKILQGPNSAYLSETMVEDLCHRRAPSISPTVTHIQSHSLRAAGWRHVGSGKMFNQRSPVQAVLSVSETLTQHCAATSLKEKQIIQIQDRYCLALLIHFAITASD